MIEDTELSLWDVMVIVSDHLNTEPSEVGHD